MNSPSRIADSRLPLAAQREQLLLRSSELRAAVAADLAALKPGLAVVDRARNGVRKLAEHRGWIAAAAAVVAAVLLRHPGTATRVGLRVLSAMEVARRVQPLARSLSRWLLAGRRK